MSTTVRQPDSRIKPIATCHTRATAVLVAAIGLLLACTDAAPPPSPSAGPGSSPPAGAPTASAAERRVPGGEVVSAQVVEVIDGDTIVVRLGRERQRVRYIGIDAPEVAGELGPEWMGPRAAEANMELVGGRAVMLEKDRSESDRFGRLLRYVWLRDRGRWQLVNELLVRQGYARARSYPPDIRNDAPLAAAQAAARAEQRGLWRQRPDVSPTPRGSASPIGAERPGCDAAYPDVCIAPPPPDLECADIPFRRFAVLPPDPHHFDGGGDGIGCESG